MNQIKTATLTMDIGKIQDITELESIEKEGRAKMPDTMCANYII
jgi:hypothetical protein